MVLVGQMFLLCSPQDLILSLRQSIRLLPRKLAKAFIEIQGLKITQNVLNCQVRMENSNCFGYVAIIQNSQKLCEVGLGELCRIEKSTNLPHGGPKNRIIR